MNPLSKKKLIAMGLTSSDDIAIAAQTQVYIERHKSMIGPIWTVIETSSGNTEWESIPEHAFEAATAWIKVNKYFEAQWEKDPFGGWHPYGTLARAVANNREKL